MSTNTGVNKFPWGLIITYVVVALVAMNFGGMLGLLMATVLIGPFTLLVVLTKIAGKLWGRILFWGIFLCSISYLLMKVSGQI